MPTSNKTHRVAVRDAPLEALWRELKKHLYDDDAIRGMEATLRYQLKNFGVYGGSIVHLTHEEWHHYIEGGRPCDGDDR